MDTIKLYCVFMRDENGNAAFLHAFDTADSVDEYIFENEHLDWAVKTVFINVPEWEY